MARDGNFGTLTPGVFRDGNPETRIVIPGVVRNGNLGTLILGVARDGNLGTLIPGVVMLGLKARHYLLTRTQVEVLKEH